MLCKDCRDPKRGVLSKGLCGRCYQRRAAQDRPQRPCECGCGGWTQGPRFISGHNTRLLPPEEQGRRGRASNGIERAHPKGWYRKINYQHEHRAVVEAHLGRKLRSDEIVHHKNHNKRDNRLRNLAVMSRAEHARLHFSRRK